MIGLTALILLGGFISGLAVLLHGLHLAFRHTMPVAQTVPQPRALPPTAAGKSSLQRQLSMAGFNHPDARRHFYTAKLIGGISGAMAGLLMLHLVPVLATSADSTRLAVTLGLAGAGFYLPSRLVDRRAGAYRARIAAALPDALDFMLICVEAGRSADAAIMLAGRELKPVHPDLAVRFEALSEALAAGAERQDAYQRLAQETDNDDLRQFGTIIVQSATMGTPVAQTMRVFSADLRDRKLRQVEERANVLPTKMTLGTMVFTVPPLLILLLSPAIFRLMQSL